MSQPPPGPAIQRPATAGPVAPRPAPGRSSLLGRVGLGCYRHRWLTLAVWIAGLACLITLWTRFGAGYDNSFSGSDPGQAVLNAHFHRQSGDQLTLAIRSRQDIRSPAVQARVADALAPCGKRPGCWCWSRSTAGAGSCSGSLKPCR